VGDTVIDVVRDFSSVEVWTENVVRLNTAASADSWLLRAGSGGLIGHGVS
jgi:hypothetical protein